MSSTTIRRSARAGLCMIILTALLSSTHAIAQAAVPISESGTHGTYDITDTLATPGARCRYEGTAGTWYLQGLHVRAPVIYGATAQLRSVGYRLLLQQRTADGWQYRAARDAHQRSGRRGDRRDPHRLDRRA